MAAVAGSTTCEQLTGQRTNFKHRLKSRVLPYVLAVKLLLVSLAAHPVSHYIVFSVPDCRLTGDIILGTFGEHSCVSCG